MGSLWGDGWFYISAGGFLVSSFLFVFLLGQYRAAVEAEDEAAEEAVAATLPEKVYVPRDVAMDEPLPALPRSKPSEVPEAEKSEPSAAKKSEATSTGGISPAVVYLQNIKLQMERLDADIANLKGLAAQQASQGEAILKRLAELAEKVQGAPAPSQSVVAAAESVPRTMTLDVEPAPEPEAEKTLPPAVAEPTLVIQAPPEPAPEPLPSVPAVAEAAPTLEPAVEPQKIEPAMEPAMEPRPARKGPVWPV